MESGRTTRSAEILLIEDNPGDQRLTREALKGWRMQSRLSIVDDGDKAIAFLRRQGVYAASPQPDIILLDLNLPRRSGREVLAEIKSDTALRRIPVVVLTTSSAPCDVLSAYENHANCYITKPINYDDFVAAMREIERFWLAVATLPGM